MFGWLKRKPQVAYLPMRDGRAFFEFCCKYATCEVAPEVAAVALVESVAWPDKGAPVYELRVATDDGGFRAFAEARRPERGPAQVGDIVLWVPERFDEAIAQNSEDARCGLQGSVVAKLALHMPIAPGFSYKVDRFLS